MKIKAQLAESVQQQQKSEVNNCRSEIIWKTMCQVVTGATILHQLLAIHYFRSRKNFDFIFCDLAGFVDHCQIQWPRLFSQLEAFTLAFIAT